MDRTQDFDKKQFIIEECMLFSVQAGLQTRNKNYPIYSSDKSGYEAHDIKYDYDNTSKLKYEIFDFLIKYLEEIRFNGIDEEIHLKRISDLADTLSSKFKPVLHEGRFRIGVAQKIINLFLKYMWSMNEISLPIHCPIDGIVKSQIKRKNYALKLVDWTSFDSITEYVRYIDVIRSIAEVHNMSIAEWEFHNWKRR